jgi:nitroimidazol reductase NimA-like FMN-containing flavoprotein (pyridoxamine 5'-phosphate oxidase superfamily)
MTDVMPADLERVLERGSFCHVATSTRLGPHVTPMVYAFAGGRVWVTTARGSVKAGAWRRDDRVAGLVQDGATALSFTGRVRTFDALDPATWGRSMREGPTLAVAAARFTMKNARFFAGYAVDARHVPLAWTPPGRVFAELSIERAALIEDGAVVRSLGVWPETVASLERFRAVRTGEDPLGRLPADIAEALGRRGSGVLAVEDHEGVVVVPAPWAISGSELYAAPSASVLALADLREPVARAALGIERPSSWRAREMIGAMVRSTARVYAVDRLITGSRSAASVITETRGPSASASRAETALVALSPERVVWWRGWSSGTVIAA